MKASWFAIAALFMYSLQNVIIERKLANLTPISILVFFYTGIITLTVAALVFRQPLGLQFAWPAQNLWWTIAICAVLLLLADYFYFSAYHAGGSIMTITTLVVLVPVFASFIKFVSGGGAPSGRQLVGWTLAAASVLLVTKQDGK